MRNVRIPAMLVLGIAVLWGMAGPTELVAENDGDTKVALVDDCDPTDVAGWAPVGCLQDKGDVTAAEFGMFLRSPLYDNDGNPLSTAGQFLGDRGGQEASYRERGRETSHVHAGRAVRRRARTAASGGHATRARVRSRRGSN